MTRKLVAYELLSLDGVAEHPDRFVTEFDADMSENLRRVIDAQDTVVLGRRTYDEWSSFWPASDIEPFASFINGVEKWVASSTPLVTSWSNGNVWHDDVGALVTTLKRRPGGNIGLHGSVSLTRHLLALGLVDELCLVVAPALMGSGRQLFDGALASRWTLTRHEVSTSGYLLVDYTRSASTRD